MGLFDFFKKKDSPAPVVANATPTKSPTPKGPSFVEKERIMVERVTTQDMLQFTNLPYQWTGEVRKFIQPNTHPFAYMDLTGKNVTIAKTELAKMNEQITADSALSRTIPKGCSIPIEKIVFKPSKDYGYTRLMCTPFTFTGQISKYPASLSFMTNLQADNTVHGDLFYGQDGYVKKAEIYFWRKSKGCFFYYDTADNRFALSRVEIPDMQGQRKIVFRGAHVLAHEAQLLQEENDYAWLQKNLPDVCPKSLSGFRRMKNQNTKNYQQIVLSAANLGYKIK